MNNLYAFDNYVWTKFEKHSISGFNKVHIYIEGYSKDLLLSINNIVLGNESFCMNIRW